MPAKSSLALRKGSIVRLGPCRVSGCTRNSSASALFGVCRTHAECLQYVLERFYAQGLQSLGMSFEGDLIAAQDLPDQFLQQCERFLAAAVPRWFSDINAWLADREDPPELHRGRRLLPPPSRQIGNPTIQ